MAGKVCKWYEVCPTKRFYEDGKLEGRWVEECLRGIASRMRDELEQRGATLATEIPFIFEPAVRTFYLYHSSICSSLSMSVINHLSISYSSSLVSLLPTSFRI